MRFLATGAARRVLRARRQQKHILQPRPCAAEQRLRVCPAHGQVNAPHGIHHIQQALAAHLQRSVHLHILAKARVPRHIQQLVLLRRLAEGRALAALLQMKSHLLRGDIFLELRGVAQAVRHHDLCRVAPVTGDLHVAGDKPHRAEGQRHAFAVAASNAFPVALDSGCVPPADR